MRSIVAAGCARCPGRALAAALPAAKLSPLGGVIPDRSIFREKHYAPAGLVQYGRGCRFACEFCSIHAFYGSSLRQRPLREVVTEIEALQRAHIFLVDDNILMDGSLAKALFQALSR